jgi:hypothetical protein
VNDAGFRRLAGGTRRQEQGGNERSCPHYAVPTT